MSPGEVPAQRGLCGSQRGVWRVGPGVPQSMGGGSLLVIMWGETGGGGVFPGEGSLRVTAWWEIWGGWSP